MCQPFQVFVLTLLRRAVSPLGQADDPLDGVLPRERRPHGRLNQLHVCRRQRSFRREEFARAARLPGGPHRWRPCEPGRCARRPEGEQPNDESPETCQAPDIGLLPGRLQRATLRTRALNT